MVIKVNNLYKTFKRGWIRRKKKEVLKGIDLVVERGMIFGVLGPNGAGKTTLLSILSTLLLPDKGIVKIFGMDIREKGRAIRERINISSGNANFLWSLSAKENLDFYGMLYGLQGKKRKKKVEELIELFELKENQDIPFDRLSTGTKQRLSLAKSLLNDPELIFLDEPTVGLDPDISLRIRKQIKNIHEERGITIVLTTHYMKEAEELCHEIIFLKEGQILARGTAQELKRMIKVGDVIKISYGGLYPSIAFGNIPGIMSYSLSDSSLSLVVDDVGKRMNFILKALQERGVVIENIQVLEPNLEDVFIEFAK